MTPSGKVFKVSEGAGLLGAAMQRPSGGNGPPVFRDEGEASMAGAVSKGAQREVPLHWAFSPAPGVLGSPHRVPSKAQAATGFGD